MSVNSPSGKRSARHTQLHGKMMSFFRYHTFFTDPTKRSHSVFMSSLNALEVMAEVSVPEGRGLAIAWAFTKRAIGSLSEQQLIELDRIIRTNRNR